MLFDRLKNLFTCSKPAYPVAADANPGGEAMIESNRLAWNEAAPQHRPYTYDNVVSDLQKKGHLFCPALKKALDETGIKGKSVAVLSCNNGRSVMSLAKLGAARSVGFDIAEEFIRQGKELALEAGISCELIATDIHKITPDYDKNFDLVLITPGTLMYYPDLNSAFAVISRLLKRGGGCLIHEIHPALAMFGHNAKGQIMPVQFSYFEKTVLVSHSGLDYYSKKSYDSRAIYTHHHRMDEIIQAGLEQKMTLISFEEQQLDVSGIYRENKKYRVTVPKSYLLQFKKSES